MRALPSTIDAASVRAPARDGAAIGEALVRIVADGEPHAMTDLARAVCDDATAIDDVRRGLQWLRERGMAFELADGAVRTSRFTPLDGARLERQLAARSAPGRWTARVVFATASTNADLLQQVRRRQALAGPELLLAESQVAGRGRLGRRWVSSPGGSLTASVALRIARPLSALDGASLVCGVAVHDVLRTHHVRSTLKWPNDLLVDGRKLGGILVEAHALGAATALVVGIGLNVCNATDAGVDGRFDATDLSRSGLATVDRHVLAAEIAVALDDAMSLFEAEGFEPFAARWNAADAFRDRAVRIGSATGPVESGIERGVDGTGALLLDVDGIRRRIISGELSLRPAAAVVGESESA